jgi:23S rRNA (adenine2503-C2)-methyltransferase
MRAQTAAIEKESAKIRGITMSRHLDLAELELSELENTLDERASRRFHARQLYRWIYRRGSPDFDLMTDLSRHAAGALSRDFCCLTPRIVGDEQSADGTRKFVCDWRTIAASNRSSSRIHRR